MKPTALLAAVTLISSATLSMASVDSDFKERPTERFTIYTGDGNYKQAYHWSFNEDGQGPPVTIFLNHGSGGEWYDEIDSEFGPCGPDYLGDSDDFDGSNYEGLCEVDDQGDELYLADFRYDHVPVGPLLHEFMIKKIVGSTQFAAWYWQDAFQQFDSPVNIFMVGRYNVVTDPAHLDNALFWLAPTDENSVSRDTLPPYNFDGYGLSDIDGDDRPMHAAPDIAGFDNIYLYKAVQEQFPEVELDNLVVEGRSNGGSAMIALAADHNIWPQHIRDFWARNLPGMDDDPQPEPEPVIVPSVTLADIMANPTLAMAFNDMLDGISEDDLMQLVNGGEFLALFSDGNEIQGTAGVQMIDAEPEMNEGGSFDPDTFKTQLADYTQGDFYQAVDLVHALYPGCALDGLMQADQGMLEDEVAEDGDNLHGYKVAFPMMFSFGDEDSLYTSACDERVAEAAPQIDVSGSFTPSAIVGPNTAVIGEVFSPARHGFDYKDVYKNLPGRTAEEQARALESRRAIERALNQAILELGLVGSYTLPHDVD